MELQERFDLHVSISQINRVRAALAMSNHSTCPARGKKGGGGSASSQPEWQEGAGSLLLLAAAHQTELLPRLQAALLVTPISKKPMRQDQNPSPLTFIPMLRHPK